MEHHRVVHPLDPLLHKLVHFTTEADLSAKIHSLFGMLDQDDNGAVGSNSQTLYIENTSNTYNNTHIPKFVRCSASSTKTTTALRYGHKVSKVIY